MTNWSPVWRVTIEGVIVTNTVLANLSISSGRTNIYTQAQAGYCTVNLINLNLNLMLLKYMHLLLFVVFLQSFQLRTGRASKIVRQRQACGTAVLLKRQL